MGKRRNRKPKRKLENEKNNKTLLEQDGTKGKQVNQKDLGKNQKVLPVTFCSDFTSNTVMNQCLSDECKSQNCITENENRKTKKTKQKNYIEKNPKLVISNRMEDNTWEKFDKTTIENQCLSNEYKIQKLSIANFFPPRHTSNITKSKNMYESKDINEDVLNMSGARPKHRLNDISDEEVDQIGNNFSDLFIHDSESVDKYESRDFHQKFHLSGVQPTYGRSASSVIKGNSDTGIYVENNFDDLYYDDEYLRYLDEYSEFYEDPEVYDSFNVSSDKCESTNLQENLYLEERKVKESFYSSVNEYKNSKDSFSCIYHRWLPERKSTLEKLQSLYAEVHEGQMKYIESQVNLKDMSSNARSAKLHSNNQIFGFFASAFSLVVDAASGASSFTQAYNTDWFQSKFQEIMDHDAEVTKDLYDIRSRCVAKYEGIEEVMRKFHLDTFNSTVNKISNTLELDKYWEAMKTAYKNDDMPKLMDVVGNFWNNACQSEVLGKVSDSVGTYVHDNPAALEGCKSTGKAMYEAVNTWAPFYNRWGLRGAVDSNINFHFMVEDKAEAERLKNISKDYIQSKLESQIEDAINLLESEMNEIIDTYFNLFKN